MVARGGLFGWGKGFLWARKGASWKKSPVVFKKVTRGFKENHLWFFKKSRVVFPKTSLKRTKARLKSNHLLRGMEPFSIRQAMGDEASY
jgi:hypothetical protein